MSVPGRAYQPPLTRISDHLIKLMGLTRNRLLHAHDRYRAERACGGRPESATVALYMLNFYEGMEAVLKAALEHEKITFRQGGEWHLRLLDEARKRGILPNRDFSDTMDRLRRIRHLALHNYAFDLENTSTFEEPFHFAELVRKLGVHLEYRYRTRLVPKDWQRKDFAADLKPKNYSRNRSHVVCPQLKTQVPYSEPQI